MDTRPTLVIIDVEHSALPDPNALAQMAAKYEEILWKYIDSLTKYRNLWNY